MTERRRREIARQFRRLLDKNAGRVERKNWVPDFLRENRIGQSTLYRWCRKLGVQTG